MRATIWMVGVVGFMIGAQTLRADYDITWDREAGTGAMAGKTIFRFYAKNLGNGLQVNTRSLIAMDYFMESLGEPLVIDYRDIDSDGKLDANVFGNGMTTTAPTASFFLIARISSSNFTMTWPNKHRSTDVQYKSGGPYPYDLFYGTRSVNAQYAILDSGSWPDASVGRGVLFGIGVVPEGTEMYLHGRMGAELGGAWGSNIAIDGDVMAAQEFGLDAAMAPLATDDNKYQFEVYTPEPGGLLLIAMGISALAMRGRRTRAC